MYGWKSLNNTIYVAAADVWTAWISGTHIAIEKQQANVKETQTKDELSGRGRDRREDIIWWSWAWLQNPFRRESIPTGISLITYRS